MSSPYVGEIRMFGGNFAPAGWAFCDGQLMPISENETLFQLIGTSFGGDGESTFGLPDLRGRVPNHMGTGAGLSTYILTQSAGTETVALSTAQIPSHAHSIATAGSAQTGSPQGAYFATTASSQAGAGAFVAASPTTTLAAASVQNSVGGQPHNNVQPSLGINYIMSLFGVFPTQN